MVAMASASGARCLPGVTGAVHDEVAAGLEGFCRPLWGVLACAAGGEALHGTENLARAILAGTNPAHPDFWGRLGNCDLRCVEMAALGWGLLVAPQVVWEPLPPEGRDRFAEWLSQINRLESIPRNNWRFFRILVNLGLQSVGRPHSPERLEQDLALIESCYLGHGWYSDGQGSQRDYYIGMAMHFYGLLIAARDLPGMADYSARYRERARLFAGHFIQWFAADGSAVPYGRSLIYRFAQGAFWSALAWAGEEALPWGVIKGLLLRHLRAWFAQPIRDAAGILSIGYGYPNLNITENYNSPASPYWAMKSLLVAGLPEAHPFWRAAEEPLPALPERCAQPEPGFLFHRHDEGHITVLASGQYPQGWHLRHAAAKYAKFAYSTRFAFSVPLGSTTLEDGAFDNTLALSEEGHYWRVREKCTTARLEEDVLFSAWTLWDDVHFRTWLLFDGGWQVRVHRLDTARRLLSAEAGHAVPWSAPAGFPEKERLQIHEGGASILLPENAAAIFDVGGGRTGEIIYPTPNSNLLHPRTVLPMLRGTHAPGIHWLVSLLPITHHPKTFAPLPAPSARLGHQEHLTVLHLPSGRVLELEDRNTLGGEKAETAA